jgi:folylpolyglutamate synthase
VLCARAVRRFYISPSHFSIPSIHPSRPVARAPFVRALDATYDTLAAAADDRVGVPAYFKFLTLLGLRCFLDAGVDVAILEVGIGGRLDATNVCPPPVAAGVAPLGFDHMDLLGDTLPAIATQKAGIFKPGSRAFTVPQRPDAAETLMVRERERKK